MTTGWPPGLLQDDCRKLSKWFASRPEARYLVRRNLMTNFTPEQARELALKMGTGFGYTQDATDALHSLSEQVEALTAERDALKSELNELKLTVQGDYISALKVRKNRLAMKDLK